MEIWEERYYDEKYGLEPPVSFRHFSRLLMKNDRNLRKFAEELVYEQIADEKKRALMKGEEYKKSTEKQIETRIRKKYSSVTTNSSKYKYQMRFDAYDNHFKELHIKSKEKEVIEWESEQLKFAKQRCNYHNDTLQKLHEAPERDQKQADGSVIKGVPLDKKVDCEAENQRAYDKSLDSVYKLLFGGVMKRENHNHNDNTGEMNINSKFDVKTLAEEEIEADEYFKNLEREMNKNK